MKARRAAILAVLILGMLLLWNMVRERRRDQVASGASALPVVEHTVTPLEPYCEFWEQHGVPTPLFFSPTSGFASCCVASNFALSFSVVCKNTRNAAST